MSIFYNSHKVPIPFLFTLHRYPVWFSCYFFNLSFHFYIFLYFFTFFLYNVKQNAAKRSLLYEIQIHPHRNR